MTVQAILRNVRMSPRKVRPLCNEVRGKAAASAVAFLSHSPRRAAKPLLKLVRSALANANQKGGVDVDNLFIKEVVCDQAPTLKRWMPRAKGSASPILKRSSHIKVVLQEK
ncbi:MAG: 50S ribosomal protein L22 [Deltaproteobacteria bacterium]|nr:50S ribosomal protein L22 [Deltaproteobacteria bacterium]